MDTHRLPAVDAYQAGVVIAQYRAAFKRELHRRKPWRNPGSIKQAFWLCGEAAIQAVKAEVARLHGDAAAADAERVMVAFRMNEAQLELELEPTLRSVA